MLGGTIIIDLTFQPRHTCITGNSEVRVAATVSNFAFVAGEPWHHWISEVHFVNKHFWTPIERRCLDCGKDMTP